MIMPSSIPVTVRALRQSLGLAPDRPDGARDVLAVLCPDHPVTIQQAAARHLALGDWPEAWRAEPGSGPEIFIALNGATGPHRIAGVFGIDATRWGQDIGADPRYRQVPVSQPYPPGAMFLTGRHTLTGVRFGWPAPEESFAFL